MAELPACPSASHRSRDAEAHLRFLDALGTSTRSTDDAVRIMAIAARLLGEHLGATRTAYADVEPDGDRFHIRSDWARPGFSSSAGSYSLSLFGRTAVENLHRGIDLVVCDVDRELGDADGAGMFNAIGIKALICAGLVKEGRLVAMMAVHQAEPRRWTADEIALVDEVVDRCWAHVERVRDTAKLLEQDRRKDEFLATLAHELRNPLAPLRYASAILRVAPPGGPQARQAQDVIDRQLAQMTRLVDDLLDLSRISRGMITLQREAAPLRGLIEQAVETARPALDAARHRLEIRWPREEIELFVDRARIVQVVGNLLNNATKYTPDGGEIRVCARHDGRQATIEVRDDGIGIPLGQQGRLFQMFAQLDHGAARAQGGLGIGLALVRTLVEQHGGEVRAFSRGVDQGSTFTVTLPLQVRGSVPGTSPERPSSTSGLEPVRVLVVEDNADGRAMLVALLELMGHEVAQAGDGESAVVLARSFEPQVVLLDLGLPGIDGIEVARRLRDEPRGGSLHLIALTGWGADVDRRRTAQAGFDQHLTKPIDADGLRDAIGRVRASPV